MFIIKNNGKIFLIVLLVSVSILTFCGKAYKSNHTKDVDIYDIVKEAFLTDKGYSEKLSKHMSQEVFKYTNIYNAYNVNSPEYTKPFKVSFGLKEDSQKTEDNITYVKMTYSVTIMDSQNKIIGGSAGVPITFTVKTIDGEWYITEKEEAA
ncbi:MAG: hypothetical protein H7Y18_10535 [Clostridiaceae bacterium]|nr:hypothetical protein [Clostridiaceae bacterium]